MMKIIKMIKVIKRMMIRMMTIAMNSHHVTQASCFSFGHQQKRFTLQQDVLVSDMVAP